MVHKKHLIKYLKRYGIPKDNFLYIPWEDQQVHIILLDKEVLYSPYKTEWRSMRIIDELDTREVLRFLQSVKEMIKKGLLINH